MPPRISEFATLIVARHWTQQFEWFVHVPLALKAGTAKTTIDELADGARPTGMSAEEALVYDFACELSLNRGVYDGTYRKAVETFGERGVVYLVGIIGYFTLISMVLNVAHTPPEPSSAVAALPPMPR